MSAALQDSTEGCWIFKVEGWRFNWLTYAVGIHVCMYIYIYTHIHAHRQT